MAEKNSINGERSSHGAFYVIRVRGQLDPSWTDWFEGMRLSLTEEGDTLLSGYIQDQAGLQSLLNKVYRLNLKLLSVSSSETEPSHQKLKISTG